ncbi:MAG: TetR/AcrR family transcriptional regulator [Pseudomonadota bacterium]
MPAIEPTTRTQAERSALSDSRLVTAAIRLIVERGTEKTTLRALGEAAGYSRGLVTYRFGSKTGLFKAVIKSVSDRWLTQMQASVEDRTGLDAILATTGSYFDFVMRSPEDIRAMRILFHQASEPGSGLEDIVNRVHKLQREQVADWVADGQAAGNIAAHVNAPSFAVRYVACIEGLTFFWMIEHEGIEWRQVRDDMVAQVRRELTRPDDR